MTHIFPNALLFLSYRFYKPPVLLSKQKCLLSTDADCIPNARSTDFERSRLTDIQHSIYSKFAAVFPPYQRRNDFAVGRPFHCNTNKHL